MGQRKPDTSQTAGSLSTVLQQHPVNMADGDAERDCSWIASTCQCDSLTCNKEQLLYYSHSA